MATRCKGFTLIAQMARVLGLSGTMFVAGWANPAAAEPPAELDHSHIGVYGTLLDFCDFSVYKFFTPKDDEGAAGYAKALHEAHAQGKANLVLIYTFDRVSMERPIEEYFRDTDRLLDGLRDGLARMRGDDVARRRTRLTPLPKGEGGEATAPPRFAEEVYAICLSEENVTWNNGLEVLNRLYDHVKQRYPGLTVYQWMSYEVPHAKLRADGWIIDPYGYGAQEFRKYLMKYLVEGKPVIACVNASEDVAPWASSEDQVRVCREFNIPVFFFAVDPMHGSPALWRESDDPRLARWRGWVMDVRRQAKQMGTNDLPLSTAEYSPGQAVEVAGDEANGYEYVESFDGLKFIDDATITGFMEMRWDGKNEWLEIVPKAEKIVSASLAYHLWSEFEMHDPEVRIAAQVNRDPLSSLRVEMSKDAVRWVAVGESTTDAGGRTESVYAPADANAFRGRNLWVRITAKGKGKVKEAFVWRLEEVAIRGQCTPPERKEVLLRKWDGSRVTYTDDFQAPRYLHLADVEGGRDMRWGRGAIETLGGADGRTVQAGLRYRFVAEAPMANIKIKMSSFAHRALGSYNEVGVSLDGKEILVKASTKGKEREDGRYDGEEVLDLTGDKRFEGIREFYVHLSMVNSAGVKTNPSNRIQRITVEADLGE